MKKKNFIKKYDELRGFFSNMIIIRYYSFAVICKYI